MDKLINKYAEKLASHGLCEEGAPLLGGLDADLIWNRQDPAIGELEKVFAGLNINNLLFAQPTEPYRSILNYLTADKNEQVIYPQDCETRTFLHDIPVVDDFKADQIVYELKRRKSVIVRDRGLITFGTVSPEQAFVVYSSVCFATTVKFFGDALVAAKNGTMSQSQKQILEKSVNTYRAYIEKKRDEQKIISGPFQTEDEIIRAMIQAGESTVNCRMVDSFFGNISYLHEGTVYISQTGSSMDELAGCIDACPLDGSSCVGITSSSEYIAHCDVLVNTDYNAILHGHPKFAVIMSMLCEKGGCEFDQECHIKCPETRYIKDIPIVPGEVGTGKYGLCNTLPPAIKGNRGAIVYGHGLFTLGKQDYTDAFANLIDVELMCLDEYLKKIFP